MYLIGAAVLESFLFEWGHGVLSWAMGETTVSLNRLWVMGHGVRKGRRVRWWYSSHGFLSWARELCL